MCVCVCVCVFTLSAKCAVSAKGPPHADIRSTLGRYGTLHQDLTGNIKISKYRCLRNKL